IGAGNIAVAFDTAGSDAQHETYSVAFGNALGAKDIANFTATYTNLHNATVQPYEVVAGSAKVAQQQEVVITTVADTASYKLSLTQGGTTYTTAALSTTATQAQVQAAISSA